MREKERLRKALGRYSFSFSPEIEVKKLIESEGHFSGSVGNFYVGRAADVFVLIGASNP